MDHGNGHDDNRDNTDIDDMQEIIAEFIGETGEHLQQFESGLLDLEKSPQDDDVIREVFRAIHSIKGNAAFLAFNKVEAVAHAGEAALARLRDHELELTPELVTALLSLIDQIRELLGAIETEGQDSEVDISAMLQRLTPFSDAPDDAAASPAGATLGENAEADDPLGEGSSPRRTPAMRSKIRVDVTLLDRLMNLVGELVLARNQINQIVERQKLTEVTTTAQRLNLVTTEIQGVVMKTRMQPIDKIWTRFPRVVRDIAVNLGKDVALVMEGRDTELDKSIIEALHDPLTHLVRNAVDHGVESADQRREAGKPPRATVSLRAFHEGGMVNIVVGDDGRGLDPEKLRQHALQSGLLTDKQLDRMSDREVLNLLFLPGFSTKDGITRISGRGVGLDVVKTNIERLGGSVDITNRMGQGTEIKLKIPLTLAIIPALMVNCQGERFAIPQVSLVEVVRLEGDKSRKAIETLQGAQVFRLRGKLLPLVSLRQSLGFPSHELDDSDTANILVLAADERPFGLLVDGIQDTEEIVVKPLWNKLKGIASFAGATVMGDGRVALILDTIGIAQSAGVVRELDVTKRAVVEASEDDAPEQQGEELVLLCGNAYGGRLAIPLSEIARLEELSKGAVERAGTQEVVQYRGEILPLVHISKALGERRSRPRPEKGVRLADDDLLQVVIHRAGDRSVGLVVDRILDVVSARVVLQRPATRPGVRGSMVIQDRITEFLDVPEIVSRMRPNGDASGATPSAEEAR